MADMLIDHTRKILWSDRNGEKYDVFLLRESKIHFQWRVYKVRDTTYRIAYADVEIFGNNDKILDSAYLSYIEVEEPFENLGIGSMLLNQVIRECKRQGNKSIWGKLSKEDDLSKLKYFYEKVDFRVDLPKDSEAFGQIKLVF